MDNKNLENRKLHDALMEALGIFEEVVPDNPDFLAGDPYLQEEINKIRRYEELECESDIKEALENAVSFIDEWFPDEMDEEEMEELNERLDFVRESIL